MLGKVKTALRVTTDAFDGELSDLISAAVADLQLAGITEPDTTQPLITRAVITYCKLHFGEPADTARLKTAYDEQKAQLQMASGYTDWGGRNG